MNYTIGDLAWCDVSYESLDTHIFVKREGFELVAGYSDGITDFVFIRQMTQSHDDSSSLYLKEKKDLQERVRHMCAPRCNTAILSTACGCECPAVVGKQNEIRVSTHYPDESYSYLSFNINELPKVDTSFVRLFRFYGDYDKISGLRKFREVKGN